MCPNGPDDGTAPAPTLPDVTGDRPPDDQRYRLIFEQSPSPQLLLDESLRFAEVNDAACALLGRAAAELVGTPWVSVVHPEERAEALAAGRRAMAERHSARTYRTDRRLLRPDGRTVRVLVTGVSLGANGVLVTLEDVTLAREAQARLAHSALHDNLTGLPNKRLLVDRLAQVMSRSPDGRDVALVYMDLDNVQRINDSLGLDAGDALLVALARNLTIALPATDTIARVVGDEFVVVRSGVEDSSDALATLADQVLAALSRPVAVAGHELVVTASAGVVRAEGRDTDPGTLLREGHRAMQAAKREGRARWVRASGPASPPDVRLHLERELREALTRGELALHYQPLVRTDGKVLGFEALLRWQHPTRGVLAPAEFLDVADQAVLSAELTTWVIDQALHDAMTSMGNLQVSVNVPVEDLRRDDFAERTLATIARHEMAADRLKIELLETQLADSIALDVSIDKLTAAGVEFMVDDFGTGYSTLSYLKRLPVSGVKVDRSFVATITDDPVDASIVRAIVDACRATGHTCVAEGVERPSQGRLLRALGVDVLQGDLLGRAAPLATYAQLIADGHLDLESLFSRH
jgi:diguanylate cyclase (GGDEF)-like protein/PAS domain S-box-containing protein